MKKMRNKKCLAWLTGAVTAVTCMGVWPAAPASAAKLLEAEFETTNDSFTGRGGAAVQWTSDQFYTGECSLFVSGRTAAWNGASRDVNSLMRAGETYQISAAVYQLSGAPVEMKMSMQCSTADGTAYPAIALATAESGEWTVLSNDAFTVPADASDMSIYVETNEADSAAFIDFYVDSVVVHGAPSVIKAGDVNGDLSVNEEDVRQLAKYLVTESTVCEAGADVNADGIVNAADLSVLKNMILFPPERPSVDGDWDNYEETAPANMLNAYKSSLLRVGNTARIREKIAKAQSGEDVTIGYIGGSITGGGSSTSEAKRFVNLSASYFSETFGKGNNVHFVNAGMAGTSSVVGNMRVDNDIFAKNCDIIFIEFAVNDQDGERFQKSYESMVKKCLMQPNEPAVVLITLCQKSGGTCENWMSKVGANYDLPVISGKGALEGGGLDWDASYGSGDTIHPGDGGHQLIADCIGYYYRQALRSENANDSYDIPATEVYGAEYANCKLVDISSLTNFSAGSWSKGTDNAGYSGGYTYSKNGNDPLKFTVNGKGILLLFKSNSSGMGAVNVSVNGTSREVTSNLQWTWGGLDGNVGYYQPASGQLDMSISSADGGTFVLYGIAVIE